jgi:hypothetical protein
MIQTEEETFGSHGVRHVRLDAGVCGLRFLEIGG